MKLGLRPFYSPECVPRKEASSCGSLTVSVGVAEFGGETASLRLLIRAADEEPYRAKADGKNRVAATRSRWVVLADFLVVGVMLRRNRGLLTADPSSHGPGPMDWEQSYPTVRPMCILRKVWGRPRCPGPGGRKTLLG